LSNSYYFNEIQKWKSFSQNFQITSLKREKRFLLIFIDLDVKYCILKKTFKNSITGRKSWERGLQVPPTTLHYGLTFNIEDYE
jgi:hypothetical protein